ncbi:hypothetical protein SAMN06269301_3528 [Geobacter sp. DSM 9736]|nr:zinc/iron-chelating domain-containing protein [Geobacter sp. DSM 9736]SNB48034.1 hypothetical protein SAMN06269301_3528 [Geobacter sp. DSM 9736]
MECRKCGTCCTAPDISALAKPLGVPCIHLTREGLCAIYDTRPAVCRGYSPDELCSLISAPTIEKRVELYLAVFGLGRESAESTESS